MANSTKPTTIDGYIEAFPPAVQERLQLIRQTVKALAPDATEAISYGIPTFKLNKTHLVYFAGWKDHISMYPLTDADPEFEAEIAPYRTSKGTARFPHKQPLPMPLIERYIRLSLSANSARANR